MGATQVSRRQGLFAPHGKFSYSYDPCFFVFVCREPRNEVFFFDQGNIGEGFLKHSKRVPPVVRDCYCTVIHFGIVHYFFPGVSDKLSVAGGVRGSGRVFLMTSPRSL